jgi:hypothetical protein
MILATDLALISESILCGELKRDLLNDSNIKDTTQTVIASTS